MHAPLKIVLPAAALLAGCLEPCMAQTPTRVIPLRTSSVTLSTGALPPEIAAQLAAQGQDPAAAAVVQDPAQAAAQAAASQRLAAFKQLVFDRRPSSILKAWSSPELKPYDPKEEEAKGAGGGAPKPAPGEGGEKAEEQAPGQAATGTAAGGGTLGGSTAGRATASGRLTMGGARPARTSSGTASGAVAPPPAPVTTSAPSTSTPSTAGSAAQPGQPASAAQVQALIDAERGADGGAAGAGTAQPAGAAPTVAPVDAALEAKKLQRELEILQRHVTLGRWHEVAKFFETLPEEQRKDAYEHMLQVLPRVPPTPQSRVPANLREQNSFAFGDVLAIAGIAPGGFDKKQSPMLAPIVQLALDAGSVSEELIRQLAAEWRKGDDARIERREAALLLSALGMNKELGSFLPTAAEAEKDGDREALNLLARHALAMYDEEQRGTWLETAWRVTQAALAKGEIDEEQKQEALRRAVELAPRVKEDLGPTWLAESFTSRPERGMEIIATIGGEVATGFQDRAQDTQYRADTLALQKTAVEALLDVAPGLGETWRPALGLLAAGWIQEASYSRQNSQTNAYGQYMQRDAFGNIYWVNQRRGGGGMVQAVEPADLLESQPGDKWVALLDDAMRPHFVTVSAQLWLKVSEYDKAFPYIAQLAETNPRKAKELADEFLRVWMRKNNPNTNQQTNQYMFIYGFEQRAAGIPLTRSKQERNLAELAEYVRKLRRLPMDAVDPKLLGEAFVAAHSTAEVYRLETIEEVFGDIGELDPVVLGELLSKMRTNLATIWRVPAVQEEAKTRRSQKEMLQQVAEGYQTALELARASVRRRGDHWALLTAVATLLHDQNNFAKENAHDSQFSEVRSEAFDIFESAAEHYASVVDGMTLTQETDTPFTSWFYAALGASDLGAIDESMVVAKNQLPRIKDALAALPEGARERHQAQFANLLFTRMSAVRPQIKQRYLEAGFEIAGDHEQAKEARQVWQFYQDLLHELRLEVVVDGSTAIGTEPFGVRIDIVHTEQIARESGGFQKYATNQNDQPYAYNYGRPTENYRDKFHDALIAAVSENFELQSVTFNSENMEALRGDEPGWQRTPFAYAMLQARGPQIDRIPEIKLDLDFLDTSGFVILPIGSSPVVVDASVPAAERPYESVQVTQVLDERRVDEGKVTLEIKARAEGMVPDLDSILDLDPEGFVVDKMDDQGAQVMRFTPDQDAVETERVWLVSLVPEEEGARPGSFRFAEPKLEGVTAVYQRYDDADLQTVSANIALRRALPGNDPWWVWLLLGLGVVAYVVWYFRRPSAGPDQERVDALRMPAQVNAFTVITLLNQVRGRAALTEAQRSQLDDDIRRIEASHFSRKSEAGVDLKQVATQWLARAS